MSKIRAFYLSMFSNYLLSRTQFSFISLYIYACVPTCVCVCVCGADRESVDYITNPADLMNLGRYTGIFDGELSGSKIGERGKRGSADEVDDDEEEVEAGKGGEDDAGDDVSKGKKMRMSLQKGEVRTNRTYY